MDLYQLEYFLEAARHRSFTQAARHLLLAQAALSEQIRKLEVELGTSLFDRGGRETTLTPAGRIFQQHAQSLLQAAANAKKSITDFTQLRAGRLILGAIPSICCSVLPALMTDFRALYPEVEMTLEEGTSEQVAAWIEQGTVELGIIQLPSARPDLEESLLVAEPFELLVHSKHRLSGRRSVRLTELASENFIFYRGRARQTALAACREAGFEPKVLCQHGELETTRALVEAGLGVGLLPHLAIGPNLRKCRVIGLADLPIKRDLARINRQSTSLSPSAQSFAKMLDNYFRTFKQT